MKISYIYIRNTDINFFYASSYGYSKYHSKIFVFMMMSSNGNIFRVTGHLCREFTGHQWIPCTKGQWRGALMFSLICAWLNGWVNTRGAGELRRHRAHYDVTVMSQRTLTPRLPPPLPASEYAMRTMATNNVTAIVALGRKVILDAMDEIRRWIIRNCSHFFQDTHIILKTNVGDYFQWYRAHHSNSIWVKRP